MDSTVHENTRSDESIDVGNSRRHVGVRLDLRLGWAFWASVGSICLACLLRIVPLFFDGPWFDEIFTVKISSYDLPTLNHMFLRDVHPPLYYYIVHALIVAGRAFGEPFVSLAWLKLSCLVPGMAVCLMVGLWVRRTWGRSAGLAALAACAVNPGLCYYSLELRNYALLLVFIVGASWALLNMLERPGLLAFAAYTVCMIGALYTHYLAVIILVLHMLWVVGVTLFRRRGLGRREAFFTLCAFGLVGLSLQPVLRMMFRQYNAYYVPAEKLLPSAMPWDLFTTFFFDYPAGCVTDQYFNTPYGILTQYLFFCFVVFIVIARRGFHARGGARPLRGSLLSFSGFMMGGYLGSTWLASILGYGKFYSGSRLAVLTLPFYLILMVGLIQRWHRRRWRYILQCAFVMLMLPCGFLSVFERARLHGDFNGLLVSVRTKGYGADFHSAIKVYLDDPMIRPWIKDAAQGISFRSLQEMIASKFPYDRPLPLVCHGASRLNIHSPEDVFTHDFILEWSKDHGNSYIDFHVMEMFELPASQIDAFRQAFREQYLAKFGRPIGH